MIFFSDVPDHAQREHVGLRRRRNVDGKGKGKAVSLKFPTNYSLFSSISECVVT